MYAWEDGRTRCWCIRIREEALIEGGSESESDYIPDIAYYDIVKIPRVVDQVPYSYELKGCGLWYKGASLRKFDQTLQKFGSKIV